MTFTRTGGADVAERQALRRFESREASGCSFLLALLVLKREMITRQACHAFAIIEAIIDAFLMQRSRVYEATRCIGFLWVHQFID